MQEALGSLLSRGLLCCLMICCAYLGQARAVATQATPLGRTIEVPFDYQTPGLGRGSLYFEFGAPYDKAKPTVFVIADAQQFFLRRGAVAGLQQIFGPAFNAVGIIGRGSSEQFLKATTGADGQTDWRLAWRIFKSDQWVEDIEAVRRSIVGDKGKILLYGRSGGAYLVHQYLVKHGNHIQRAFTSSPVNPFISRELGISLDSFWEELGAYDRSLQAMLRTALDEHPEERIRILITLQRQHFFVSADELPAARAALIRALANNDSQSYERARKEYQVEEILNFARSPVGIPIRVRELEFIYPSGEMRRLGGEAVYPYLESQASFMKPLVSLMDAGQISAPAFDIGSAHRLSTEVFILAARWDEAVDYRTSIALAYAYPRHELFIADDNHVFARLKEKGFDNRLVQAFLRFGLGSPELQGALNDAAAQRWKGQ